MVFDLGWRPADLYALSLAEIVYWFERAVEHAETRRKRNKK